VIVSADIHRLDRAIEPTIGIVNSEMETGAVAHRRFVGAISAPCSTIGALCRR
jgi:hypothetical protein